MAKDYQGMKAESTGQGFDPQRTLNNKEAPYIFHHQP
jgi:hypothetical protein